MKLGAIRSRLRSQGVSMRKQVGDTESMFSDESKALEDSKQEL